MTPCFHEGLPNLLPPLGFCSLSSSFVLVFRHVKTQSLGCFYCGIVGAGRGTGMWSVVPVEMAGGFVAKNTDTQDGTVPGGVGRFPRGRGPGDVLSSSRGFLRPLRWYASEFTGQPVTVPAPLGCGSSTSSGRCCRAGMRWAHLGTWAGAVCSQD